MHEYFDIMFGILIVFCGLLAVNARHNLALGKPTSQRSTAHGALPGRAVDGNNNGDFNEDSCTHTQKSTDPWWEVDLGKKYTIDHVTVFARTDCNRCADRLGDVQLFIGYGSNLDDYVLKGFHAGTLDGNYTFQLTSTVYGRWVRITRLSSVNGTADFLSLCEVEVMGGEILKVQFEFGGDDKIGTGVLLQSSQAHTKTQCCIQCKMEDKCSAINFNNFTKVCEKLETVTAIEESSDGSSLYQRL